MARFTFHMRNGKEFDIESSNFKLDVKDGKVRKVEAAKKDRGVSLLFVDVNEIVGVTRDTRLEEY